MSNEKRLNELLAKAEEAKRQLSEVLDDQKDLLAPAHLRAAFLKMAWDASKEDEDVE